MTVLYENILLPEFVASVESSFRPMAEARRLQFTVDVEPGTPPRIVSDHQRIFQIIRNLFSNALKFTNEGDIRIRFSGESSATGDPMLSIAVSDTGIGIPEDKQEMIFDAFRQVDGSTSRRFGGTGLGLSISRSLAQLLGGELAVQSAPGVGSTFTLLLPQRSGSEVHSSQGEAEAVEPAEGGVCDVDTGFAASVSETLPSHWPAEVEPTAPEFAGHRLLLVDDDVRNIYAMSSMLEDLGFETEVASNGRQALDFLAARNDIDVVLMDMMMPVMDGYQALRTLKQEQGFSRPVIALTAYAMKGDREKCLAAGADDYIAKPVAQADLITLLRQWVK